VAEERITVENFFVDIVQAFRELDFEYTEQFFAAMLPMIFTVFVHGYGMRSVGRCYKRFGTRDHGAHAGPHVFLLIAIVAIMLLTHFLEVIVWAFFYYATQMMHNFQTAMFFSINSYTTLGASNLTLPGRWQGLDGFEAMTAMLMFGWSTAVLAAVVQKSHSIDD
jgi:hypothetical protein